MASSEPVGASGPTEALPTLDGGVRYRAGRAVVDNLSGVFDLGARRHRGHYPALNLRPLIIPGVFATAGRGCGQITKICLSDGCGGETIPKTAKIGYCWSRFYG